MAPTVVSSIAQSTPQLSTMRSPSLSVSLKNEEPKTRSANVSADVAKDNKLGSVDTVKISFQALQSSSDVKKEEARSEVKKDEAKKNDANKEKVGNANDNVKPEATTAKVQFVYNQRGNLITKYLDSSGALIYQVPSKLMLLSQEADSNSKSKSVSSLDTRV